VLEPGIDKVEDHLGIDNLYESVNTPLIGYLNNAIKAKELFKRDKDYVVLNGEVLIVDEHTGRILAGRRYNEGMHQAIEAKEGVEIKDENQTLATITLQNYFRLYDKLSGMTGTAETEAAEFTRSTSSVWCRSDQPPMIRKDQPDLVYRTEEAKFDAVVEDIEERHRAGSAGAGRHRRRVEKSEYLSQQLRKQRASPHRPQRQAARAGGEDRREAGRKGAVTVATNMAGRGTDIMLGGNGRVPRGRRAEASKASTRRRPRTSTNAAWDDPRRRIKRRSRPSTTRSRNSAACTCSAPSGTSRAASTTSCVVVPAVRVTRASPASTCRCRTTSCGCSTPTGSTGHGDARSPTTCRSRQAASPAIRARRARSRRATSRSARTSSSTTT
jgi:preprotein translocase subunit SecA